MESTRLVIALCLVVLVGCAQKGQPNPYVQPATKPGTEPSIQQAAALAFIAYVGESMELPDAEADARIESCMVEELARQPVVSDIYTLAWGPKVHRFHDVKLDDNMIYAVWDQAAGNLVIAIRGTNFKSISDWIDEDFYVSKTVEWPSLVSKNVNSRISQATDTGLSVLKMLAETEGDSLLDLISSLNHRGELNMITVTGHSLAGALAPVFALWLKEIQAVQLPSPVYPKSPIIGKTVKFKVVPLAGATPGNAVFAKYYDDTLGKFTMRLHNPYDVVPLAWYLPDMKTIKNIYWTPTSDIRPSDLEASLIDVGMDLAYDKDYAQIKAGEGPTWGQINHDACYSTFAKQAAWQHHDGYCNALGITMPAVNSYCVDDSFCDQNPRNSKCQYKYQLDCLPLPAKDR